MWTRSMGGSHQRMPLLNYSVLMITQTPLKMTLQYQVHIFHATASTQES
jgi:hypothetical protein